MTKNMKTVSIVGIAAVLVLTIIFVARDLLLKSTQTIECNDGHRKRIDIRNFLTQYSAYSVDFEAMVGDKAKFSGKLEPKLLQALSESLQQANEFRKFLVAGYNSCAITKVQYAHYGVRFQAMDGLSRQIERLISKPALSGAERGELTNLVNQYMKLSQRVTAE